MHTNLSQFKCCVTAEIKNIPNLGYKYSFGNRVLVLVDHTFAVKISSYEHWTWYRQWVYTKTFASWDHRITIGHLLFFLFFLFNLASELHHKVRPTCCHLNLKQKKRMKVLHCLHSRIFHKKADLIWAWRQVRWGLITPASSCSKTSPSEKAGQRTINLQTILVHLLKKEEIMCSFFCWSPLP